MVRAEELRVSIADVEEARRRIAEVAWRTPVVPAGRHEDGLVYVKLECLQRTGSFKIRGAWNRMSRTSPEERRRGFVTVSAGNHGQAVAWCARKLDAPCTVWVPETAVERKVSAIEALGAAIRKMPHEKIMDSMMGDAFSKDPQVYVAPFGDRHVIAGQGTIGLEILEDLPDLRTLIIPIGGGGLATGIATVVRAKRPRAKIYGVQAERAAPIALSWKSRKPERVPSAQTIADGIAATISFDYMLPRLLELLDGVFTVDDEAIRRGVHHLMTETHAVAEPAGAASLAAARIQAKNLDAPVVCIVSGGNIDPNLLAQLAPAATIRA